MQQRKKIRITKQLNSKFTFDKKQARKMTNISYYVAQTMNNKDYEQIERLKKKLSTVPLKKVSDLLEYYRNLGLEGYESPVAKILLGIYKKNRTAVETDQQVYNENLVTIISQTEMLLLAYRSIRGNRGALTRASYISKEKFNSLNDKQKKLYLATMVFPDQFNMNHGLLTSELLRKGLLKSPDQKLKMNTDIAIKIATKIAPSNNVDLATTLVAIDALFRKGRANANARDSLSVEFASGDKTLIILSKYELKKNIESIAGHQNVRRFAEEIGKITIPANIRKHSVNPSLDLKGDLADRINRFILSLHQKENARVPIKYSDPVERLTRLEEICCCIYAQNYPNLDELAESNRLKYLLDLDLANQNQARKMQSKDKNQKKK